jgi:hypothetical protein
MKIIIINGQMRNKPFLIVIYRSSLVKPAMNAKRVCKLRNGVNKTLRVCMALIYTILVRESDCKGCESVW